MFVKSFHCILFRLDAQLHGDFLRCISYWIMFSGLNKYVLHPCGCFGDTKHICSAYLHICSSCMFVLFVFFACTHVIPPVTHFRQNFLGKMYPMAVTDSTRLVRRQQDKIVLFFIFLHYKKLEESIINGIVRFWSLYNNAKIIFISADCNHPNFNI